MAVSQQNDLFLTNNSTCMHFYSQIAEIVKTLLYLLFMLRSLQSHFY